MSTAERVGILPDVPTIAEAGLPGFQSVTWYGLFGPKGLDPAIAEKLNAAVRKALKTAGDHREDGGTRQCLRSETVASSSAHTVKKDRAQWAEVVKKSGASID